MKTRLLADIIISNKGKTFRTYGDLAKMSGLSRALISMYVQRRRPPNEANIKKICKAINVDISSVREHRVFLINHELQKNHAFYKDVEKLLQLSEINRF